MPVSRVQASAGTPWHTLPSQSKAELPVQSAAEDEDVNLASSSETAYPELKGTHKDHLAALAPLAPLAPKCKPHVESIILGSLFCAHHPLVQTLF